MAEFSWMDLAQRIGDQFDPRAETEGPNWREKENMVKAQQMMEEEARRAQIRNLEDQILSRKRDDERLDKSLEQQDYWKKVEFDEKVRQDTRDFESGQKWKTEEDKDRDALRGQNQTQWEVTEQRQKTEADRNYQLNKEREKRLGKPEQPYTSKEYYEAGIVKSPSGTESWSKEQADAWVESLKDIRGKYRGEDFESSRPVNEDGVSNLDKEKNRADAVMNNPSSTVSEQEDAAEERNSAVARQVKSRTDSSDSAGPSSTPTLMDRDPILAEGQERKQLVKEFSDTARAVATQQDPEAAARFAKMISEKKISQVMEVYGPELVEELRKAYQQAFGKYVKAPF